MNKSARVLGAEYGLNAQEMNRILVENGILEGEPGGYSVTEKGRKYINIDDRHEGPGGYYDHYYSVKTYDDSIKDCLDVNDNNIAKARAYLRDYRAQQRNKVADCMPEFNPKRELVIDETPSDDSQMWLVIGVMGLASLGIWAIGKVVVPRVKKWWEHRKSKDKSQT